MLIKHRHGAEHGITSANIIYLYEIILKDCDKAPQNQCKIEFANFEQKPVKSNLQKHEKKSLDQINNVFNFYSYCAKVSGANIHVRHQTFESTYNGKCLIHFLGYRTMSGTFAYQT